VLPDYGHALNLNMLQMGLCERLRLMRNICQQLMCFCLQAAILQNSASHMRSAIDGGPFFGLFSYWKGFKYAC
jgi:hypothetical protein